MVMQQIIYASRPLGYSPHVISQIVLQSQKRNAQHDITGALICRNDIFLQLLEGPVAGVERLFNNICVDPRHQAVQLLVRAKVEDRLFPAWSMKFDPAQSWLSTPDEIDDGALLSASARDVRAIFVRSTE